MTKFVRSDAVLWRQTADRVIVLPVGAGNPTVLTGTAMALWGLLREPLSLGELVSALARRYETSAGQIGADVEPALDELCCRGVVAQRVSE